MPYKFLVIGNFLLRTP